MKLGLHVVAYQCADYLDKFLQPWLEFKKKHDSLVISFGHAVFKEFHSLGYPIESKDGSHELLRDYAERRDIDFYQFVTTPVSEAEARTVVLQPIRTQCDYIIIGAPDEIYTLEEIEYLYKYIQREEFIQWFRIEFKNLTFNEQTYTTGFCPPRVFRNHDSLSLSHFRGDDEPVFVDKGGQYIDYLLTSSKKIPTNIVYPLHYTWLDNQRSRDKIAYQTMRWAPPKGYGCSFKIDENGKLAFNEEYYKLTKQTQPILHHA